jgi:hypothetical protein
MKLKKIISAVLLATLMTSSITIANVSFTFAATSVQISTTNTTLGPEAPTNKDAYAYTVIDDSVPDKVTYTYNLLKLAGKVNGDLENTDDTSKTLEDYFTDLYGVTSSNAKCKAVVSNSAITGLTVESNAQYIEFKVDKGCSVTITANGAVGKYDTKGETYYANLSLSGETLPVDSYVGANKAITSFTCSANTSAADKTFKFSISNKGNASVESLVIEVSKYVPTVTKTTVNSDTPAIISTGDGNFYAAVVVSADKAAKTASIEQKNNGAAFANKVSTDTVYKGIKIGDTTYTAKDLANNVTDDNGYYVFASELTNSGTATDVIKAIGEKVINVFNPVSTTTADTTATEE